ncbi:MAG TPA: dephospho-CoA kinase [Syntrophorhabdaceae bacterium]|nr:dephospho-CoA kinase [Syntrophorhabdaceae bacterium]HPU29891.1 dephospho-CoA kinase [Syntrophorhabdaceae bacterium]
MIKIGITGIIGSGKTTVSNLLRSRGFKVIDLDSLAKNALEKKEIIEKIRSEFGEDVIIKGKVSPEKLKGIVFISKEKLKKLEGIIHPEVIKEISLQGEILKSRGEGIMIIDGPLIFEKGLHKELDKIIVVSAEQGLIKERLKQRGMDEKDIEARTSFQIPLSEKEKLADYVIYNNGTKKDLQTQVDLLIERIREWEEKDASK